jgi:putative flippase GtrA
MMSFITESKLNAADNQSRKGTIPQFLQFAGVGIVGTIVHYTTLTFLVESIHAGPVISSGIGAVLGAITNYFLNYYYTFNSSARHHHALPKFLLIAGIGLILNTAVMGLCTGILMFHYLVAQLLATALVLLWTFSANRIWTFRQ